MKKTLIAGKTIEAARLRAINSTAARYHAAQGNIITEGGAATLTGKGAAFFLSRHNEGAEAVKTALKDGGAVFKKEASGTIRAFVKGEAVEFGSGAVGKEAYYQNLIILFS